MQPIFSSRPKTSRQKFWEKRSPKIEYHLNKFSKFLDEVVPQFLFWWGVLAFSILLSNYLAQLAS